MCILLITRLLIYGQNDDRWFSFWNGDSTLRSIVGKDSVYIFDNTPDCENEGFIRFRDHKTDKAGMFNRNGNIVIPAEYNGYKLIQVMIRNNGIKL